MVCLTLVLVGFIYVFIYQWLLTLMFAAVLIYFVVFYDWHE